MKTTLFILGIALASVTATTAQAQVDDSRVKILPTANADAIKVLYAIGISDPLTVKFYSEGQLVTVDRIHGKFAKGLSKTYDVKKIRQNDFWVEITSPQMQVTYRIVPSSDGTKFTPLLEKTVYNHEVVTAKN